MSTDRVTLQDVADAVGVSKTTASNAFNRPDQLSETLRAEILDTAASMQYPGPNPMAQMLSRGRAGALGVVFAERLPYAFDDPVAIAFAKGVASVCEDAEVGLLMLPRVSASEGTRMVKEAAVDGFIIYSMPAESPIVQCVVERRLPVVSVDQDPLPDVPSVRVDDRGGAYAAARHVLALGHRRIGLLSLDLRPDGRTGRVDAARRSAIEFAPPRERLRGYADALAEVGLSVDDVPIEECPNEEAVGDEGARRLLSESPRPTAILAMSDRIAIGALRAASDLGLDVPDDVSVVGFDDVPAASRTRPPLTTVRQPLEEKGERAARMLLDGSARSKGSNVGTRPDARATLLACELVVRATTAAPPA